MESGTISFVSRFKCREEYEKANRSITQGLRLTVVISAPLVIVSRLYP